ncbi:MAG: hypothetical protein LC792_17760 [Actinobacteria bacterium]|nr:hypothetical protein [Actinomycetota bacterium]
MGTVGLYGAALETLRRSLRADTLGLATQKQGSRLETAFPRHLLTKFLADRRLIRRGTAHQPGERLS